MIKCCCQMSQCEMQASLDEGTGALTVEQRWPDGPLDTSKEHRTASMYLDANGAVALIKSLKRFLLLQADKP